MNYVLAVLVLLPVAIGIYAYLVYPLLLLLIASRRPLGGTPPSELPWPMITVTVPCYNEEYSIRQTLEALLAIDYPPERRQIVVISDASSDGTDMIVGEFADRGVELLRLENRRGKSAAENAAGSVARGEIIVNTDATIRILPTALKALVNAFADPTVGVASGRDVSVLTVGDESTNVAVSGESGYVGYEMTIRSLETRLRSIVGASGCFYGIRSSLYETAFPETLSRDFASALMAVEHGYRAVSVYDAVCLVPQTKSLTSEFRRKIRTMARGMRTLWYKKRLMDPCKYGSFAWMLFSHKLCRWLIYPAIPVAAGALLIASTYSAAWRGVLIVCVGVLLLGGVGVAWPTGRRPPLLFRVAAFAVATNVAGLWAWVQVLKNNQMATWEPTRR